MEEIRWKTSPSASCLHMAMCRAAGLPAADAQFAAQIEPALDAVAAELAAAGWLPLTVLNALTSLTVDIDNNKDLIERVVSRLNLPVADATVPVRVAGAIADLEAAVFRSKSEMSDELASRVRPLREQWEARGPGMLTGIRRLADPIVVPASAEVVLVAPYIGGYGAAHPFQNRVTLEAVLYHPLPGLPETLRLAWLLCQLNSDLPAMADMLPAGRCLSALKLAMIPPVLAAAEEVELAHCNEESIDSALHAWQPEVHVKSLAGKLWAWWNTWLEHPTRWPVAVAALEQLAS